MDQLAEAPRAKFGLAGFFLAVASLLVVMLQLSSFFAPDPEPQKTTGQVIGEIAADIRLSAQRALAGEPAPPPPPPAPAAPDYSELVTNAAMAAAALAVILGGIALYRHEPARLPMLAVGIGLSAVVMQYFFWLAMVICAAVIIGAIINNIGDILDF